MAKLWLNIMKTYNNANQGHLKWTSAIRKTAWFQSPTCNNNSAKQMYPKTNCKLTNFHLLKICPHSLIIPQIKIIYKLLKTLSNVLKRNSGKVLWWLYWNTVHPPFINYILFHHQQKWKIQFSAHIIYTIKNLTTQKNPT